MKKVTRVEKHVIDKNHKMYPIVDEYCFKSKNLYNFSNYVIRQEFIKNNNYIAYNEMAKLMKHEEPFKNIGSNSGQHTLKLLHQNWKSFFVSIKDWSKNKNKYLGKPNLPRYLKKEGRYVWVLTNMQSKIKDGHLFFSYKPLKMYNNLIKTKVEGKHMQTRFIPRGVYYVLEIVYEILVPESKPFTKRIIGIDLGLNRIATIQNNFEEKPIAINGGKIKSVNNYSNKLLAKYRSIAKTINNLNWTDKLQKITDKRHNKIDYLIHNATKYIVNYCVAFNVDTVVIGYNEKWKQNISIGSANQTFTHIPFQSFVSKLEYKLENKGIKLIKTEESYTSKASFIDGDQLTKGEFSGKRVYRGLYESKEGKLINADVNGASNIIRKVFPEAFEGIKGVDFHPTIINI